MSHDVSHDEYGKIVHRPCNSCISSVQEIEEDFIEFSLLTQTWSEFKSWLESYREICGVCIMHMGFQQAWHCIGNS